MLQKIEIQNFTTHSGHQQHVPLSFELFGQPLHSAPVVLVNHALTGNSNVAGEHGWWNAIIGDGKCIDTRKFTVLAFNIPGNGYDGFIIENYKDFIASDVARIFLAGLQQLGIDKLFGLIGGSLGGGIAWEMVALQPNITQHLIPVASDWKSTDWLIANCQIQEQILKNSSQPVHDARMHAMLCYRTPESFKKRFQRSTNEALKIFNVESWLMHHGEKLQERFQVSAYRLMNQLLKTIDITKGGQQAFEAIESSAANIHIIGVNSDLFFTAEENKETFKQLAQAKANVTYGEVESVHGHDAFLIEFQQLQRLLEPVFNGKKSQQGLKILKFGGKSLSNGEGLQRVLDIITKKYQGGEAIGVVLSAREKATDTLEKLLESAANGKIDEKALAHFERYQTNVDITVDITPEMAQLTKRLKGVSLLGDYSLKTKDEVLSFGELLSCKLVVNLLRERGVPAVLVDTRKLLATDDSFGNARIKERLSKANVLRYFSGLPNDAVPIITGFIAANEKGETTTLGRNGSNYTAALLANYLDAGVVLNYTHVDGIFTADPNDVPEAKIIEQMSYEEANELANFGATVLHAKTIIPLIEKNIPFRILNTFNENSKGTLISSKVKKEGIRSLSVIENVALINLEGRGLLGKVGIDARIFNTLGKHDISVSIISQGSSERGIGLVVDANRATAAKVALDEEFATDYSDKDVNTITIKNDIAVISVVGQDLSTFHHPYNALIKNGIVPLLFNNTISGKNISLVVEKKMLKKAVNVMHGQIFGVSKRVNIAVFGHGTVGGTLIRQILHSHDKINQRKGIDLRIFAVANSKKVLLNPRGVGEDWEEQLASTAPGYALQDIIHFAQEYHLENLIAIDNTASTDFVSQYFELISAGFDLVSSNKIANTLDFDYYQMVRDKLEEHQKQYLYETNVGAGLPLIDTIKLLHLSGENITQIKGVFSGSLSYVFNTFSESDQPFSAVLQTAMQNGYTEPDPREDLSGNDVARKLLILARELDLENEFADISIDNLIPQELQEVSVAAFLASPDVLDAKFNAIKKAQKPNHVLRYIGDLYGNLQQNKGILEAKLISVPKSSALGQVSGADSIVEIFTESYGDHPIVIQGAGAGAAVTARGVFGDILRIAGKG
ncbi:Bifunctional aspartokinase I/homoserine dehydrogenase I [Croceitalea dokdonensis DOKDO 023]|uniref:Bifunctional aspartokinase I/homoserine dehydrogenase I n=1 Tax=Croceitalea dokdonensis DOKDO 023 TaxID=1300341 RepID=A0A0P7B0I1_9FLAO|nr:bifunctional aspartate kinase/homoserine dehydrogenase I [Croceitalea dokdonensis]KPM32423.1 Bifunctional aspartokinase I/homoserine dehydrogenase I [Croceitalea dokdonensis DOKDO 023]